MDRRKFLQAGTAAALLPATAPLMASGISSAGNATSAASTTGSGCFIKPFVGSWFEFEHHNQPEGVYWNPTVAKFTTEQWKTKIKEMHEIGMEYLVLLAVAYEGKTYYPSKLQPRHDYVCPDPLEAVLQAADECGIKFFMSNDYWSDWLRVTKGMSDEETWTLREKGMEEVAEKYGHHKSFYGWYYPHETGLDNGLEEIVIQYVNRSSKIAKSLMPKSLTLIAPYGTNRVKPDDNYIKQLERLDVDIMAYQDEVGVKKTVAGTAGKYYEGLYKAHAKAGRARFWADLEIFDFEGRVYHSALIPAPFERIKKQLEDIAPYVEHVLIYQYLGMMNKPGTTAFAGHPDSEKLYTDYYNWLTNK